jgi:hypothetical protein
MECQWAAELVLLAGWLGLPPGSLSAIGVSHDSWCPIIGGSGEKPCQPEFVWLPIVETDLG